MGETVRVNGKTLEELTTEELEAVAHDVLCELNTRPFREFTERSVDEMLAGLRRTRQDMFTKAKRTDPGSGS